MRTVSALEVLLPVLRPSKSSFRRFFAVRRLDSLRRARAMGDDGFTLIELAIVIVILPLVIGGIAVALIVTLQDQTGISTRVSDSVDSQVTSTFFVRDVESAQYVTTKTPAPTTAPWTSSFGPAKCGSGSKLVVGLSWPTGTAGASREAVVSYWATQLVSGTGSAAGTTLTATSPIFKSSLEGEGVVQTTSGTTLPVGTTIRNVLSPTQATLSNPASGGPFGFAVGPKLVRDFCIGSSTPSAVTTSRDFFSPFTQAVVSCVKGHTAPTCTTTSSHKTASHQWVPTYAVSSVTLAVSEPAGKYNYNVSGAPRVSNSKGSQFGTCVGATCFPITLPTLLLLGGFKVLTETSSATHVTVIGTAVLNTGYLKMTSGSLFTVKTTTPGRGKILSSLTPPTRICSPSPAQCSSPPTTTVHPWPPTHIPAPIANPLAGLPDPGPAAIPPICHTGVQISVTSSLTLTPGQYKNCPLHIKSHGHVTLNPGLYEFDTGITLTGGTHGGTTGSLNGTSGVLIYLPCNKPVNGNQVDSWATTCNEQVKVKNSGISAKRIATGPYGGLLWYWQNQGDTAPFTMSGTRNHMVAHGVMYAPGNPVTLTGLGTSQTPVGAIITANLTVSNSNIVIVGP